LNLISNHLNQEDAMLILGRREIEKMIPHRFHAQMIDSAHYDPTNPSIMIGYKQVQEDDIWLKGHYDGYPIFPGHCQLECVQLVAALLVMHIFPEGSGLPIAAGVDEVRWKEEVHPNDRLLIKVEFMEKKTGIFFCKGDISNQYGKAVMRVKSVMGAIKG
jgi:3-hydroxyacyl-[acyl-carrier-protein] dehydratase